MRPFVAVVDPLSVAPRHLADKGAGRLIKRAVSRQVQGDNPQMPKMPRKLLIVAFHYPPVHGSSGIQRTLKFSTYLRDHGWEPLILTVSPQAYEQVSDDQLGEIPDRMLVERAFGLDTAKHLAIRGRHFRWMAQPDRWISWWPAAVWSGLKLIRQQRPQAILSTFPIATAHLIAMTLQRLTKLPWIADCRDSMTEPGYPVDPLTWRTTRRIEAAMVKRCTKAIFTTSGTHQMYAERYPQVPASRWAVIENGYDEENFRAAESEGTSAPRGSSQQVTLVHSGILYPHERDPRPFFDALSELKASGDIRPETLRVVLRATAWDNVYRPLLDAAGIGDIVHLEPPVSYISALREMLSADALLLFQGSNCNHQIPAKMYEYLRSSRPIFALTDPSGNTAAALQGSGANDIVDIADKRAIADGLRTFLRKLRDGTAKGVSLEVAERNSRRSRTGELARLLDEAVGSR